MWREYSRAELVSSTSMCCILLKESCCLFEYPSVRQIPVRIWATKSMPRREPVFQRREMFLGVG
jgi:hypothetical protein